MSFLCLTSERNRDMATEANVDDLTLEELEALTNPSSELDEPIVNDTNGDVEEITKVEPIVLEGEGSAIEGELVTEGSEGGEVTEPTPDLPTEPEQPLTPLEPSLPTEPENSGSQYLDYDTMNFLGKVEYRNKPGEDAPAVELNGPIIHLNMKTKMNSLLDLLHPDSYYKITSARALEGSKTVVELLYMAFNAPMRDEINNSTANLQNCFQLYLEAMAHPLMRPAFNPKQIYCYRDSLLQAYPDFISFMLHMTDMEDGNPVKWRAKGATLRMAFANLRKRWPRSQHAKFDAFVQAWVGE